MQYKNIYELFKDIYLYGDDSVIPADKPQSLTIGWYSIKHDTFWEIRISDLRQSCCSDFPIINLMGKMDERRKIMEFVRKNREILIRKYPEIPRLEKLKAFW